MGSYLWKVETVEKAGPEGRVRPSGIYFGGVVVLGDLLWGPVSLGSMPGILAVVVGSHW